MAKVENLTTQQLEKLWMAQAKHTCGELAATNYQLEDDGGDYNESALDLCVILFRLARDNDIESAMKWLNDSPPNLSVGEPEQIMLGQREVLGLLGQREMLGQREVYRLGVMASDGVCQALYDLQPPALGEPKG